MTSLRGTLLFPQQPQCRVVQTRSFDYLDGELIEAERDAITQHLADCAACQQAYDRDAAFRGRLRRSASIEEAPVALRRRLREALRRASDDTPG